MRVLVGSRAGAPLLSHVEVAWWPTQHASMQPRGPHIVPRATVLGAPPGPRGVPPTPESAPKPGGSALSHSGAYGGATSFLRPWGSVRQPPSAGLLPPCPPCGRRGLFPVLNCGRASAGGDACGRCLPGAGCLLPLTLPPTSGVHVSSCPLVSLESALPASVYRSWPPGP